MELGNTLFQSRIRSRFNPSGFCDFCSFVSSLTRTSFSPKVCARNNCDCGWTLGPVVTVLSTTRCNDPTIGSYNHYHLSPNGIPRGNQRWYGLVYFIQIAGKPRIRPSQLLSSLEVLY